MTSLLKKELILKEIDQLENAVCSFSNSTNWLKKAGVPSSAAFVTLLVHNEISYLKILAFIFVFTFFSWLVDSYCFYYQRKLRFVMGQKFKQLDSSWPYGGKFPEKASFWGAIFNTSHILYYIVLLVLLIPFCVEVASVVCSYCKT